MKRKLIIPVLLLILCLQTVLAGCGNNISRELAFGVAPTSVTDGNSVEDESPIALILINLNYAWGYHYEAEFVTENGTYFQHDFSDDGREDYGPEDVFNVEREGGVAFLSKEEMTEISNEVAQIEVEEHRKYDYAMDSGKRILYAVKYDDNGTPELVLLGMSGDAIYVPKDKHAMKICERFGLSPKAGKALQEFE